MKLEIDAHHRHREVRASCLIDRLYWDTPYHLVPSGKTGIEAFAVIRAAMAKQSMVAIGRLVMSTRERICGIEIEEGGLVLTTLRTAEEVRGLDEVRAPDLPKPEPPCSRLPRRSSSSSPATSIPASSMTATRTPCAP